LKTVHGPVTVELGQSIRRRPVETNRSGPLRGAH
jgi:hypothetical protein